MHRRSLILSLIAAALAGATGLAAHAHQQPIVLQWQTSNLTESQYEPVWKRTIAEFEAANPGIRIEPVLVARKDHWTKFVAAAQARKAPCIVSVDLATAAYNGYLLPLDKYFNAEPAEFRRAWSDGMLSAAKWDKKLYGLPIWGGTYAEIYNRDLVVKAGTRSRKAAAHLRRIQGLGEEADRQGPVGDGGARRQDRHHDARAAHLDLGQWRRGVQRGHDRGDVREESEEPAGDQVPTSRSRRKASPRPAPTTTNYLEQTNLFAQGKIATMRNAYWAVAKVVGDNPAMKGKMFVAPNPVNVPNAPTLSTMTASSISHSCAHPEAAWKFIKFDADRKWSVQRAKVANWMPMRNDLGERSGSEGRSDARAVREDRDERAQLSVAVADLGRHRGERHRRRRAEGAARAREDRRRSSASSMCG